MSHISPYEKGWEIYISKYESILRTYPSVGRRIVDFMFSSSHSYDVNEGGMCSTIICGEKLPLQIHETYAAYLWEKIKAFEIRSFVETYSDQPIDWVIELGSGPSHNLFNLWNSFGPNDAQFIGAEYTDSGIRLSDMLHKHYKGMNFISTKFDYYNMQLEQIVPKGTGLIFSSYSIEQIKDLNDDFFDQIARIPGLISSLHIEPIGWQFYELDFIDTNCYDHEDYELHRHESVRSNYNQNFALLFKDALNRNIIETDFKSLKLNFLSHRIDLPGTVLTWSPKCN